jgi:hypothetical protein
MAKKTAKKAAKTSTPKKATKKRAYKKRAYKKRASKKNTAASSAAPKKRRGRPTDANLIKNLEARIKEVKDRMSKKSQKDLTHLKSATKALKAINSAMVAAKKAGDKHLRHALADGFRSIASHYKANGYATPKANLPRGRRPKK